MRYDEAVKVLNKKVQEIRGHIKTAAEAENLEDQVAGMKEARVKAGQLYTELGLDLKALQAGNDPITARESREADTENRKAARLERKAAREAAKAAEPVLETATAE